MRVIDPRTGGFRLPVQSSTRGQATVCVVIPSYNYESFLPQAIDSALTQEGVDLRVIVVDDASTDASAAIARRLAESDDRLEVVVHHTNLGHVETYNHAVSLAKAEFVVKLDADDLLTSGSLRRAAELMQGQPNIAFCYGSVSVFHGDPPGLPKNQAPSSWTIWHGRAWLRRVLRRGHNVIYQPEVMFRREALTAVGAYDPRLRWAEDYNLFLRLAAGGGGVGRVNGAIQGQYREHPGSFQRSSADMELDDLKARAAAVSMFFDEHFDDKHIKGLERMAFRSLAVNARQLAAERAPDECSRADDAAVLAGELDARAGRSSRLSISGRRDGLGKWARALTWRVRSSWWERHGI